ncbi:serine/threonine-protein kinase ULK3-like isoform X3 [Bolinopsis microptera]|uniref:serine/threonine-protein kinase ULK3-like isoform X3 n=1 Tax=Bolinopsis microptera TaxID=2820187 RepID=UPI0030791997
MAGKFKVEGYKFYEKLGTGTYATVLKAKDVSGQNVAIKCIKKKSLSKRGADNLITEIQVLKDLKHRHIVQLHDFTYDDDHIYLILEFCKLGDLSSLIAQNGKLSETLVKDLMQQLALALRYMNKKKVAHMDLKPQNILLTGSKKEPKIKVADFGFAKILKTSAPSSDASLRGSLLYMAPEIILSRSEYDGTLADMWSVGVMIFECLCGRAPFASRTYDELLNKIAAKTPVQVEGAVSASKMCISLIEKLLERDPQFRLCFQKFYHHPFLDMEHAPTPSSLPAARDLVEEAVCRDNEGDYENAIRLYTKSLDHFMAAIHYEDSEERKDALRGKVTKYMSRAEELKTLLREGRPRVASGDELIPNQLLIQISNNDSHLKAALSKLKVAFDKDEKGEFTLALGLYENALEALLKVHNKSQGRKKELLRGEVNKHMRRAEEIKSFLQTLFLQTVRNGEPSLYNYHTLPNPRTAVSAATQSTPTIEDGRPQRPASSADVRNRVKSAGRDVDKGDEVEEETTYSCSVM